MVTDHSLREERHIAFVHWTADEARLTPTIIHVVEEKSSTIDHGIKKLKTIYQTVLLNNQD
jgi:hypothetical protein